MVHEKPTCKIYTKVPRHVDKWEWKRGAGLNAADRRSLMPTAREEVIRNLFGMNIHAGWR